MTEISTSFFPHISDPPSFSQEEDDPEVCPVCDEVPDETNTGWTWDESLEQYVCDECFASYE